MLCGARGLVRTATPFEGGDLDIRDVLIPLINEHANYNVPAAGGKYFAGTKMKSAMSKHGMGIAWHLSKNFHTVLALNVVAPTGQYNKNDVVNIGRNYYSINPLWGLTYRADNGFEASAKLMYWINTVNTATSYVSGQEFDADYLVGWHYQKWGFGANGFYRIQTTNDKQFGTTVRQQ